MHCMSHVPGKFACRILIQGIGFALPVTITVPVVVSLLITFCGLRHSDPCYFKGVIPDHLFFVSPNFNNLEELLLTEVRDHCLLKKTSYMQTPKTNCVKKNKFDAQLILCIFRQPLMFRAYLGPSSGGATVCIQQLVFIIPCRRLSVVLVG